MYLQFDPLCNTNGPNDPGYEFINIFEETLC